MLKKTLKKVASDDQTRRNQVQTAKFMIDEHFERDFITVLGYGWLSFSELPNARSQS